MELLLYYHLSMTASLRTKLKRFWPSWSWKGWGIFLVIVLVILGGSYYYYSSKNGEEELTFIHPETKSITKTLEVSGVIDADERASLRFAAGGKIASLRAKEGDALKKGQTIATIDQTDLRKRLEQDLNAYTRERLTWEQTLDNSTDRWLPESEQRTKEKEQTDLRDSVLAVEIRDVAIRETVMRSPFDGILVKTPIAAVGVNVLATDVFEVVNPKSLVFKAAVDEADIALVQTGQQAEIFLDSYPDSSLPTAVKFVALTSAQSSSGTVFRVDFPLNGDSMLGKYRLGMNGDVRIALDSRTNVLTVPLDATRERDDKTYVDVRTGEKTYEEREVTLGLETDDTAEVLSGLSQSDEVLLPQ
jgi:RND family efflux transporter MFP subunit